MTKKKTAEEPTPSKYAHIPPHHPRGLEISREFDLRVVERLLLYASAGANVASDREQAMAGLSAVKDKTVKLSEELQATGHISASDWVYWSSVLHSLERHLQEHEDFNREKLVRLREGLYSEASRTFLRPL